MSPMCHTHPIWLVCSNRYCLSHKFHLINSQSLFTKLFRNDNDSIISLDCSLCFSFSGTTIMVCVCAYVRYFSLWNTACCICSNWLCVRARIDCVVHVRVYDVFYYYIYCCIAQRPIERVVCVCVSYSSAFYFFLFLLFRLILLFSLSIFTFI